MKLLKILRKARPITWFTLLGLAIKNLKFIYPTYKATKITMDISNEKYGQAHFENGPENAFRHALWNIMIARYCQKKSSNLAKALHWTRLITDWHESAFYNRELAQKMDLHNNEVGRNIYFENPNLPVQEYIDILEHKTNKSLKLNDEMYLNDFTKSLVHIKD